jgi:regulator of cell morphogenesis and NO signaling
MKEFKNTDTLGQIVAHYPGAGDFFMTQHIDFCCGGERSLQEALEAQGLTEAQILQPLNQGYKKFQESNTQYTDWAQVDIGKLIDHILNAHHHYLREEMPRLSALLFKLIEVHGEHHPELFRVHKLFNTLRTELEAHLIKEEVLLFPALKAYKQTGSMTALKAVREIIESLETEHVGAGDLIKAIRTVTDHYTVPDDSCSTYALTYTKLQAFEKNTFEHVHLENNILFKQL